MSIQFVSVKCPECNAVLSLENGRDTAFCTYCGAKIMLNNEDEHIYRTIDEAGVKQAETDRIVRLRMLEMEEKSALSKKRLIIVWLAATGILILIGIIGFSISNFGMEMCIMLAMLVGMWGGMGLFSGEKKKNRIPAGSNEVVISETMGDCEEKNYRSIEALFKSAGFRNVSSVPLNDLSFFGQMKNGQVESVTINGQGDFEEGDIFPKDSSVLITYHSR